MTKTKHDFASLIKDHVLVEVSRPDDAVRMFRLQAEDGMRMLSTTVIFSDEGIIICGDLAPGRRFCVKSDRGYGIEWFAGDASGDYLCEKFLSTDFHVELAVEELRREADTVDDPSVADDARALAERIEGMDDAEAIEELCDGLPDEDLPGIGYEPKDAALLQAIKDKFRELWLVRAASELVNRTENPEEQS